MIAATERATLPSARAGTLRADSHGWAEWSPPAQVQALSLGRPVFVDFTAAWCLTCQANKRLVLHSSRVRSEEHTSELQSQFHLVCRLLLEKKKEHNYSPDDLTLP